MAINFQLFPIGTKEPIALTAVDEQVCKLLGCEVHDTWWGGTGKDSFNWYDTIGFQIASGKDLHSEELLAHYRETWQEQWPVIEKIIMFLRENYTSTSFVTIGKH